MFIYRTYNHNWRNISTIYIYIYIYITRLASNEIFSPSNKIHREVGWAKDLSAPLYDGQHCQLTSPVLLVKLSARKLVNTGPGQSNVTAMLLFNFSIRSASK